MCDAIHSKLLAASASQRLGLFEKQNWVKMGPCLNYFTASDWQQLMDPSLEFDSDRKAFVLINRLASGGFAKPSSEACADLVCLLASCGWNERVNANSLYEHVHRLGKMFPQAVASGDHLPTLKEWPDAPAELPQAIFKAMYTDDD